MMKSLRELPSGRSPATDFADWLEIEALVACDGNVSREDLARALHRPGSTTEESARTLADDAFAEVADRATVCGQTGAAPDACYPFKLSEDEQLVEVTTSTDSLDTGLIYLFLLAVTRRSMSSEHRKLGGVDPTKTFELLCADVLVSFWGGRSDYSNVFVIGTAGQRGSGGFPKQIDALCSHLDEGDGWRKGARSPGAGDGGLDLAVWRKFRDKRAGGLVGFAQCKTGEHWDAHVGKPDPRAFCGTYMTTPLLIDPLGIYMIPHRLDSSDWERWTRNSRGLFFDRCRIVQYADQIDGECRDQCRKWLTQALSNAVKA